MSNEVLSKSEIFERIKTMADDIARAFDGVENMMDNFNDKLDEIRFPHYRETQRIAGNLVNNYPDLPEQVSQFLECLADGIPYENKVNGLALVAV